ncbi:MAG TPA: M56 family metallopeptidase [Puia sp.]|nr:M56 family metallopeptidase [Puia sp.]
MPVIQPSQLLQALGWSLINSVWQMALLWVLHLVLSGTGKGFSATTRHMAALLLTAAGTGWFVLTFFSRLSSDPGAGTGNIPVLTSSTGNNLMLWLYTGKKLLNQLLPYLTFAYLCTVCYLFARYLYFYRHLERLKSTGLQKISAELRSFCANTALHLGIHKKISVWLSSAIDSPVTIGFLKPVILIPIATVTHLSTVQVESILLHELTHIRRNDYLINLLLAVAGNIFFFNPFARLLIASIRREREHCCDDLVLQYQYNPHVYATALLSLERNRHSHHHFVLAAVGRNERLLLERVKRVTGHPTRANRYSASLFGCLLLAAIAGLLVLAQPVKLAASQVTVRTISVYHPGEGPGMILGNIRSAIPPSNAVGPFRTATAKTKHRQPRPEEIIPDEANNDLTMVSDTDDDPPDEGRAVNAVQAETRVYSIAPVMAAAPAGPAAPDETPYVPSASFSYKILIDTLPAD